MILRKPYAFFIKHFRLIHLCLGILIAFSLYRTYILLDFFNEYVSKTVSVIGHDLVGTLFNGLTFVMPLVIILITVLIMVVMIIKKKPYMFYVINILFYVFIFIALQIIRSTVGTMELKLIDIRVIRLVRDLVTTSFLTQIASIAIVMVRATGFNIKKLDFQKDLDDMEIEEGDDEEFEVDINVDGNKTVRKIRRVRRMLRYKYKENRLLVNISVSAVMLIIIGIVAYNTLFVNKSLSQNTTFTQNGFTLSVVDSYLTTKNYLGQAIDEDHSYLIIKIRVKNNRSAQQALTTSAMKLEIGYYSYYPVLENASQFLDFSNIYQGEKISNDYVYKNLIFQIPNQLVDSKITFNFIDTSTLDESKVNIKYTNLDKTTNTNSYVLGDTVDFSDSIIGNYKINITSYQLANRFKYDYQFCVKTDECYSSYEYIYPSVMTNYDKSLLKITGTMEIDSDLKLSSVNSLYDFIYNYGRLKYVINGETKYQGVRFKEVKSNKSKEANVYYLEVLREVIGAEEVSIVLHFRGQNYEYVLK